MSASNCPNCGQRLLIRHGVSLPPRCADIFDMIERAGDRGVLNEVLCWVFYSDKPKRDAARLVAVHINRINDFLQSTDVRISTSGRQVEPYKVIHQKEPAALD